jgi:hypothetical protein
VLVPFLAVGSQKSLSDSRKPCQTRRAALRLLSEYADPQPHKFLFSYALYATQKTFLIFKFANGFL